MDNSITNKKVCRNARCTSFPDFVIAMTKSGLPFVALREVRL